MLYSQSKDQYVLSVNNIVYILLPGTRWTQIDLSVKNPHMMLLSILAVRTCSQTHRAPEVDVVYWSGLAIILSYLTWQLCLLHHQLLVRYVVDSMRDRGAVCARVYVCVCVHACVCVRGGWSRFSNAFQNTCQCCHMTLKLLTQHKFCS